MDHNFLSKYKILFNLSIKNILKSKNRKNENKGKPPLLDLNYQIPFQNEILKNNSSLVNSYRESKESLNLDIFQNTFLHNNPIKSNKSIQNPYRKLLEEKLNIRNPKSQQKKKYKFKLFIKNKDEEQKNNTYSKRNTDLLINDSLEKKPFLNTHSKKIFLKINYKKLIRNQILYNDNKKNLMKLKNDLNYSFENGQKEDFMIRSIRNKSEFNTID